MDKTLPRGTKENVPTMDVDLSGQRTVGRRLEQSFRRQNADLEGATEEMAALEKNLKERIKFEMLLAELSAHFVNLPAGQIDGAIQDAQRRMCEFLDLDRASLWQFQDRESGMLQLTHLQM